MTITRRAAPGRKLLETFLSIANILLRTANNLE